MKSISLKNLKAMMAVLLCVSMLLIVSGCGKENNEWVESEIIVYEDEDSTQENSSNEGQSANTDAAKDKNASPDKLSNPNVTVFWPITVDDHPEFTAINKAFEKKYGGKVTVVGDGKYDDRGARLTNLVQSKTQVDVVRCGLEDFPSYQLTKLIRPIDLNEFDTSKAPYNNQDDAFKGKNCTVLATCGTGAGVLCLYNKTMFENAGLETPLELYKKGQWNWNTFRDAARTLSQDMDGDGKNDVLGFADYDINGLLCSNGTSLLIKNGDKYTVNTEEKVRRAYQFYFDMYNVDKSINRDPWSWSEDMVQGKLAMVFQRPIYILYWLQDGAKFDYDFVPMPKGPDASKFYINVSGQIEERFALGTTCKNPEGAYAYIKFYIEQIQKSNLYNEKTAGSKYTADQEKRLAEYSKLAVNAYSPVGFGNLKMDARSLLWEIRGGKSVGATIEYWKNVLQQDINIALMAN